MLRHMHQTLEVPWLPCVWSQRLRWRKARVPPHRYLLARPPACSKGNLTPTQLQPIPHRLTCTKDDGKGTRMAAAQQTAIDLVVREGMKKRGSHVVYGDGEHHKLPNAPRVSLSSISLTAGISSLWKGERSSHFETSRSLCERLDL